MRKKTKQKVFLPTIRQDARCFGLSAWGIVWSRLKMRWGKQGRADRKFMRGIAQHFSNYVFGTGG